MSPDSPSPHEVNHHRKDTGYGPADPDTTARILASSQATPSPSVDSAPMSAEPTRQSRRPIPPEAQAQIDALRQSAGGGAEGETESEAQYRRIRDQLTMRADVEEVGSE